MKGNIFIICIVSVCFAGLQFSFLKNEPADKAALGKLLFFDPILSSDQTISCASCHKPSFAFSDTSVVSIGVKGKKGSRNTPSAMNVRLLNSFFWDGRAKTLEEQAIAPIANPDEMNLPVQEAVSRLRQHPGYSKHFMKIFNSLPDSNNLAAAIAAFERTLETSDSPFDRWKFMNDSNAVDESVKKGFVLFNGKGKCIQCHFGADLTANEFRNIGLFNGRELNDSGRYLVTKVKTDIGKFRTQGLRNVAVTSPYMHNGIFKTLEEVVDFYNEPDKLVKRAINRDSLLSKPLGLNKQEKTELITFLRSLTDERFIVHKTSRSGGY